MNADQLWSLERLGHLMTTSGRVGDAVAIFQGLTRLAPERSYSWYALAHLARQRGDVSGAVDFAVHAAQLDSSARNRLLCAELQLQNGDREGALRSLHGLEGLPPSREQSRAMAMRRQWFGD